MGQHGSWSPRAPKTALGCTSSILAIPDRSGPVENRPFISKLLCLARTSRNVTKMGQHGSGSPRAPKTALGCTSSILAIPDRSGPVENRPFISKLLCLARISRNVTKMGQHWSGSQRAPKTALGCKSLILVIHDRSGTVEMRLFFQSCSVQPKFLDM